jgi:hypothetical protein
LGHFDSRVIARRFLPSEGRPSAEAIHLFNGDCPAVRDAVKRHFVASLLNDFILQYIPPPGILKLPIEIIADLGVMPAYFWL